MWLNELDQNDKYLRQFILDECSKNDFSKKNCYGDPNKGAFYVGFKALTIHSIKSPSLPIALVL